MNEHQYRGDLLIVDDTPDNLRLLSEMLQGKGYDVRSVKSGSMALMGIQAQPPDLVLLDINMPGMSGFEVCEQLKSNPKTDRIPVIFISALNEVFDKIKAFSVGGIDYITKPFQEEEVLARVENQLTVCRLQAQLLQALEQERMLNQRIEELATLEERNRIAREVHDSLGHLLVALNIQMETALTLWNNAPNQAYTYLLEAKNLGSEALTAVRQSVSDMRSDPLQGKMLEDAIQILTLEFQHTTGITPECQIDLSQPVSNRVNTAAYRILQEALTNICKYAKATFVQIQIQTITDDLFLVIKDNGRGFSLAQTPNGFGLQGMRERVDGLGGQINIVSEMGAGCHISVRLPRRSP